MKRKITALFISLTLCLSLSAGIAATVSANEPGCAPSPWAQEDVLTAVMLRLVPAFLQCHYQDEMTRAEFAALAVLLYEVSKNDAVTERAEFSDTDDISVVYKRKDGNYGLIEPE